MKVLINSVQGENAIQTEEYPYDLLLDFCGDTYIGTEACLQLNKALESLASQDTAIRGKITLVIYPENKQIDLGLFGLLCLIKSKYPGIRALFDLRELDNAQDSDIAFKIRQQCTASYLFFDKILLEVQYKQDTYDIEQVKRKDSWLNISNKFIPLLKIASPLYHTGFILAPETTVVQEVFTKAKNMGSSFSANKLLLQEGLTVSLTTYCLISLLAALDELRITELYIQEYIEKRNNRQLTSKPWTKITGDAQKEYYRPTAEIVNRALRQPPLFILLFARLVANIIPEYTRRPGDRSVTYASLTLKAEEIYHIAYTVFSGLREIAGNIIDHSSERTGLLLARIFTLDELTAFKKHSFPGFASYTQQLATNQDEQQYLLDITVLDCSTTGIIETFRTKTIPQQQQVLYSFQNGTEQSWQPDRKILDDFFRYPEEGLEHEVFQVIANTGLIVFNKHIEQLKGFFFVSSPGTAGNRTDTFNNQQFINSPAIRGFYTGGTHYNIVFPLFQKAPAATELMRILSHTQWNNYTEHSSILDYSYIRAHEPLQTRMGLLEVIIDHTPIDIHHKYRQEMEIVSEVVQKTRDYNPAHIIPVIHTGRSGLQHANPGHLIRLLAGIKYRTLFKDIIIVGCLKETVLSLFELLHQQGKAFWGEEYCVVFYVKEDDRYLPIVLFGKSYDACIKLNHLANDVLIGQEKEDIPFPNVSGSKLFEHKPEQPCRMIEIDTVIEIAGLTIFEHYAKACLLKELNH